MVNLDNNFNRPNVSRNKTIRDKKRARILNKKRSIGYTKHSEDKPLTKKQEKKQARKQKNLERIYKELDAEEGGKNNISKKVIKRRNHKKKKLVNHSMDIDEN